MRIGRGLSFVFVLSGVVLFSIVSEAETLRGSTPASKASPVSRNVLRENDGMAVSPGDQPPAFPEKQVGIEFCVRYAAENNPGLKAAFDQWKAAVERIPQVKSLPDPHLTYAYYIERVETRVGPQRQRVGLSQTFPWFGKLSLRGEAASKEAEIAYYRMEAVRLRLVYRVKQAYHELRYVQRAVEIQHQNVELLDRLETIVRSKYRTGQARYADVIRVQTEREKARDEWRTFQDALDPARAKLNAALGRPADAALTISTALPVETPLPAPSAIMAQLQEASPYLHALGSLIRKEQAGAKLAKKNYFPDITLGVDYIDTGPAHTNVSGSGDDPVLAKVSINLPIWYGKYRAAEREARYRIASARRKLIDRRNTLAADLRLALFKYQDADRKKKLYGQDLIPKAKQTLNVVQAAYTSGKADYLDLIQADRELIAFQLAYERALADKAERAAEIEMLAGGLPKQVKKTENNR